MYQKSEKFGGYYWHKHREKQLAVESSKSHETERSGKSSTDDSSADIFRLDGPSSAVAVAVASWQKIGRFEGSMVWDWMTTHCSCTVCSRSECCQSCEMILSTFLNWYSLSARFSRIQNILFTLNLRWSCYYYCLYLLLLLLHILRSRLTTAENKLETTIWRQKTVINHSFPCVALQNVY